MVSALEANRAQQAANMINMIADAEDALDHGRNSCLGPNIAHKAVGFSATLEQGGKPLALLLCQLRYCASPGAISQRVRSAGSSTGNPLADCPFGHAQSDGDLLLWPTLLMQVPGTKTASFAPVGWLWCCIHGWHDTAPL